MPAFLTDPVPHEEAAAFVRGLPAVSRQVFDGLLPDLKAFAFTITGIEKIEVLQNAREAIAKLPEGAAWDEVKGELLDIISPYMRSTEDAERRAELLLRMHGGRAYAIAAWRAQQEDADIFPYVMWQTMGDGRVRDAHRALNGRVFRLDSDFIKEHYPPDGWNCRCQAVSMSEYDVRELREADAELPPHQRRVLDGPVLREVEQGERIPDPDRAGSFVSLRRPEGSPGWKPGQLQIPLDAMRTKYDPDIWAQFEREARSQRIDERGQTVWEWLEQATAPAPGAPPHRAAPPALPPAVSPARVEQPMLPRPGRTAVSASEEELDRLLLHESDADITAPDDPVRLWTPEAQAQLATEERGWHGSRIERGMVWLPDGTPSLRVRGGPSSINLGAVDLAGKVFSHWHPKGLPPSTQDAYLLATSAARAIRVATATHRYTLASPSPALNPETLRRFLDHWEPIAEAWAWREAFARGLSDLDAALLAMETLHRLLATAGYYQFGKETLAP